MLRPNPSALVAAMWRTAVVYEVDDGLGDNLSLLE